MRADFGRGSVGRRLSLGRRLRAQLLSAIVVVATFLFAGKADAAVSIGATGTATGSVSGLVTTATPSWSATTANGSLLVAILTYNGSSITVGASGWTLAASALNGSKVSTAIYYIENASAQSSATFTATASSGAGPALSVQLLELQGMVTSGSLDITASNTTSSVANSLTVTPSSTTSNPQDVAIVAFAHDNASNAYQWGNPPSGFTSLSQISNTTRAISAYRTVASAGTQLTETMSIRTSNKTANIAGVVASFKANVAAYYWRGGASDCASGSNWTTAACWAATSGGAANSGNTIPSSADLAVFESAKVGNCTISSAITVGTILVKSGYTGTINHSSGNISLAGSWLFESGTTGTFNSTASSSAIIGTNLSAPSTYAGDLVLASGTFTLSASPLNLRSLTVSAGTFTSGSSAVSTNSGGTVGLTGGTITFGTGGLTPNTSAVTVGGGTVSMGNHAFTANGSVEVSGGTMTFGTGQANFNGGLSVSGGTLSMPTSGTGHTATTVSVSAGQLTFGAGTTFVSSDNFALSGGTVTANDATLTFGSGVAGGSDGFTMTGGTFNGGTSTLSVGITGKNGGQTTTINGSAASFDGTSGTQHFYGVLNVTSGMMTLGTADMVSSRNGGSANTDQQVIVGANGWLNLTSSFTFPSTTAMTLSGKINAGIGTVTFTPALTFSGFGVYDVQQSTTKFNAAVTMSSASSLFWGGTGTTTFAVAPTFTSGTFQVGSSGTTGSVIFTAGATFASGMTVAFPSTGGTLSAPGGQTIAINGTVTSSAGAVSSRPKIARSSGTTGITVSFGSTSVLNIDGLEFDNSVATGVTIADGATYTLLKNLIFQNNVANSTSTAATHLAITSSNTGGTKVLQIPGCFFDATAQYNVTLSGVSGSTGVRAIFEFQSTSVNGARAGAAYDLDADTNGDNVADTTTANRYGSVVEWVRASPTDTAGTAVGFPTAAFDWNTFQWYGIYVAYKDTTGSSTADVIWNRNTDGSAAYSFSVPQTSGDIVGTPKWDTVNEVTKGVDANGDGDQLDTDVRVVYVPTSLGHIIKLVDNGSGLARPSTGPWASDFTDSNVSTITSAFAFDGTNLYFGGTGSSTTKVFGVQVAGGTNEAKLVKTIGSVSAISTTPSVTTSGGSTYVFLGSTATASQAYIYRINMTNGTVDASYTGATTNINGGVVLINSRAYAVSDGGKVYALDALNFASGGFTNLAGFPYTTSGSAAVKNAPWVDYTTNYAYFGDDGGKVYTINASGTALTGFPLTISSSIKITSTPIYVGGSGVIAIGANDGYLYFIDRNNGTGPSIFKRYFITGSGSISNVAYNTNTSSYMVSSSDGKLTFVNASDVTDPTASSQ